VTVLSYLSSANVSILVLIETTDCADYADFLVLATERRRQIQSV